MSEQIETAADVIAEMRLVADSVSATAPDYVRTLADRLTAALANDSARIARDSRAAAIEECAKLADTEGINWFKAATAENVHIDNIAEFAAGGRALASLATMLNAKLATLRGEAGGKHAER